MKQRDEPLRILLLGGFEVHTDAGESICLPSRNARGLLAYLAMSTGRALTRERLATLLWGGKSEDKARASLRQTLSQLRRSLNARGGEFLKGDGDAIALDSSVVTVDAVRLQALAGLGTSEALEEASQIYRGDFLEGFGSLSEAFEEWLLTERMRLQELAEQALIRLLDLYRQAHATDDAIRVALRLLSIDPVQESVHRSLMALYAEEGRPRFALRQYEMCRDLLQRELGVAPGPETRQLAEQIQTRSPIAVAGGQSPPPDRHDARSALPPVVEDDIRVPPSEARLDGRSALTGEIERRFVTLVTCSIADVAALAARLDPEELRTVVTAFEDCCQRVVSRHGGHVQHFAADHVIACFGHPSVDELDAERAVRAGLEIAEAAGALLLMPGVQLQARISIASGEVVTGRRIRDGGVSETAITGGTVHVVTALRDLVEPGGVLVAESTWRLLGDLFDYQGPHSHALRGFDAPVRAWRVIGERKGSSRFKAIRGTGALSPLVGREEELELLERRWERAKTGSGQVVVLAGEAGIGKSRLIEALRDGLAGDAHVHISYYCSPHHQDNALYPVIEQLERAAGHAREDSPALKLEKLEALLAQAGGNLSRDVPLIASLLSIPTEGRYPPLDLTPQRQKEKTLEVLDEQLIGLARRQPILIVFEDLHWGDATTRDAVEHLVDLVQNLSVLMVVTHRSSTPMSRAGEPHVTSVVVKRLLRSESEELVRKLTGDWCLPTAVLASIVEKADGVPLFIEELTKNLLEATARDDGVNRCAPHRLTPGASGVPDTLYDLLMARLDRLGSAKLAAQEAAVIGRRFSYELLAAVTSLAEPELRGALARLAEAELVYAQGTPSHSKYSFKHALVQETAYSSLSRTQRTHLHGCVAKVLEQRFPGTNEISPDELAHHFAGAGLDGQAIFYWQKAAERAMQRSAHREAIASLDRALASLRTLPQSTDRDAQELGLQVLLGQAWILTAGYVVPEVEAALVRARDLCREIDDPQHLFFVLLGLWQLYVARQEFGPASDTAERLLSLARSLHSADFAVEAHVARMVTLYPQGSFREALIEAEHAIAIVEPDEQRNHIQSFGYDGRMVALVGAAWGLWALGYPEQASDRMQEALVRARELAHPYSQCMVSMYSAWLNVFCRKPSAAREDAEASITLAVEHGFPWPHAFAKPMHGWALAEEGLTDQGIREIREGLAALEHMGHSLWRPHQQGLLAAACARAGRVDEALSVIEQALATADRTGELEFAAELHRRRGALMLQRAAPGGASCAEQCFVRAIEIARRQEAKSWELRATTSLARLWCGQGRGREARDMLAPILGWFTEGFDTPDLKDAGQLLAALVRSA